MTKDWEEFWTEEVTGNLHVNLPSKLEEKIAFDDPLEGPSVHWSLDKPADVMVISDQELEKDRYESIKTSQIIENGRIRPPKELLDEMTDPVYPGLRIVYLVHEGMLDDDPETPNSAYLLTDSQAREFLNETDLSGDSLRDDLQSTPAFLPPVR